MNQAKIKKIIKQAGGPSQVARDLGLSRTTVWRWQTAGFPDTDYSGKTQYALYLAKACVGKGHKTSHKEVLAAGRP